MKQGQKEGGVKPLEVLEVLKDISNDFIEFCEGRSGPVYGDHDSSLSKIDELLNKLGEMIQGPGLTQYEIKESKLLETMKDFLFLPASMTTLDYRVRHKKFL